jgi:hypothetical protein
MKAAERRWSAGQGSVMGPDVLAGQTPFLAAVSVARACPSLRLAVEETDAQTSKPPDT